MIAGIGGLGGGGLAGMPALTLPGLMQQGAIPMGDVKAATDSLDRQRVESKQLADAHEKFSTSFRQDQAVAAVSSFDINLYQNAFQKTTQASQGIFR